MKIKKKELTKLLALFITICFLIIPITTDASQESIISGIKWADSSGEEIDAHGGGIIQVGNYFYWFGERREEDGYLFDAVACYRSTDLKNWEYRNDVLTPSSDSDLDPCNIERPKVVYNESTEKYVMWMHWENGTHYGEAKAAVAYCDTVDGDYTYVKSFRPYEDDPNVEDHGSPGYMSRDCTLFVDDDGTAYFLSSSNENMDMHVYKLTNDYLDIDYLVTKLWVGGQREAPAMVKKGDYYFILTSGCTGWAPNQAKYSYSTSISSGWSSLINIGDSNTYHSQPTYIITVQGSTHTSYLYLGDRWAGQWGETPNKSSYVMLPINISGNTMSMSWYNTTHVDTSSGSVSGSIIDYYIENKGTGKAMDGAGTANGDNVLQYDNWGGSNQRWKLSYDSYGYYELKNIASGRLADVSGASTANGASVIQWNSNGGDNQKWKIEDLGGGDYRFINKNSNKVLDASGSNNGDDIIQWSWWGGSNQIWNLVE